MRRRRSEPLWKQARRTAVEVAPLPSAVPQVILVDERPTGEIPLSPEFHQSYLAVVVSRCPNEEWPPDPADAEARRLFEDGQKSLYERQDSTAAIRCFQQAIQRAPDYLKAWVAMTVALLHDNHDPLGAESVLRRLLALEESGWMTRAARRMCHINLGDLYVHLSQAGPATERGRYLDLAAGEYRRADELSDSDRIGLLASWAWVSLQQGERDRARDLWRRVRLCPDADQIVPVYLTKFPELRGLDSGA